MNDEQQGITETDAGKWLSLIAKSQREFHAWNARAENIEKLYADLHVLANNPLDRSLQIFWSNIEIIAPSVYARAPKPSVAPKFQSRDPVKRTAAEFLERNAEVALDFGNIDEAMQLLRNDLLLNARGVPWVVYEGGTDLWFEHLDREDFVHDLAKKWSAVDWVARRVWLDTEEIKELFGDSAQEVGFRLATHQVGTDRDSDENDGAPAVWEIWCKSEGKQHFVIEGDQESIQTNDAPLDLETFFPCPRPAYGTLAPRKNLIPVPDVLQYQGQLQEINDLTRRIHTLSEALKVKGFFSAGGDIGEAIERAIKANDDAQVLVPIPNMAGLAQGGGEPIIWLPIVQVGEAISSLMELRRQTIDDVYQIVGIADIMRGATESDETLGAQALKQQNGSRRVQSKQQEMVRVAADMLRIGAEIIAEKFPKQELVDRAQMDLPTDGDIEAQIEELDVQHQLAMESVDRQNPEEVQAFQQASQQAAMQREELEETVTVEDVLGLLRDQRTRPFTLDIETDSTVWADEAQEKASRAEFAGVFGQAMGQLQGAAQLGPEAVEATASVIKFALAPYRVGRELEGVIDKFTDNAARISQNAMEMGGKESETVAQASMQMAQAELQKAQADLAAVQVSAQAKQQEIQLEAQEAQQEADESQARFKLDVAKAKAEAEEQRAKADRALVELQIAQAKLGIDQQEQDRKSAETAAKINNEARTQEREDVKTITGQ